MTNLPEHRRICPMLKLKTLPICIYHEYRPAFLNFLQTAHKGMDRAILVTGALVIILLSYATMVHTAVPHNPLITMQPMKYYIRDPESVCLSDHLALPPKTTNLQRISLCLKRSNIFRLLCTVLDNFPT